MAARKKIALFYTYHEGWIGGTYYIQNLVHALQTLPDPEQPELIVVCRSDEEFGQIAGTGYRHLRSWPLSACRLEGRLSLIDRAINKIARALTGKPLISRPAYLNLPEPVDLVFPCPELKPFADVQQRLYWIPDFQEIHLPQFFDEAQIERRRYRARQIADGRLPVVFSSQDAFRDFQAAYSPGYPGVFVIPFAVTHPPLDGSDIRAVQEKYGLRSPYFFAPNQFWKHKDHQTLIRAAEQLRNQSPGMNFQIAFSGKEDDFRNPDYTPSLKRYVSEHGLEEQVRFLGFIDRREQLLLMKHALAVVQPSLFEGWSTVVEDAKALGCPVIASGLPVHREQLAAYPAAQFFPAGHAEALAGSLRQHLESPPGSVQFDYGASVRAFGRAFMAAVSQLTGA